MVDQRFDFCQEPFSGTVTWRELWFDDFEVTNALVRDRGAFDRRSC